MYAWVHLLVWPATVVVCAKYAFRSVALVQLGMLSRADISSQDEIATRLDAAP